MKRKTICVLAILGIAAMVGCSKTTENKTGNDPAPDVSQEEEPEERPTDRPREIESMEDFEYELIDGSAVITRYTGSDESVEVPETIEGVPVTKIGFYAFEAKYGVTSVLLPETTEYIGEGAFMDCADLECINIPETVKGIDGGAFGGCANLRSLVIPKNTEYVREETFTACEGLVSITINNPDLEYESWGLEELPDVVIFAPEGSAVCKWAAEKGFSCTPV